MAHPRDLDPTQSALHLFGFQLRAFRNRANLSQASLGGLVHLSEDAIAKYETGRKWPERRTAEDLDAHLGADGVLLGAWQFAIATRPSANGPDHRPDQRSNGVAEPASSPTMSSQPMDMEDTLNCHAEDSAAFGSWAEQLAGGDIAIERLRQRTRRLAAHALTAEPAQVATEVSPLAREVFDLARGHHRPAVSRELYQAAAGLCSLMAWIAGDIGNLDAADMQARTALVAARTAEDPGAEAWALITASKTAFWRKDYQRAATLAEAGQSLRAPGTAPVMLACQAGDAYAALGDPGRLRGALVAGYEAADRATGVDSIGGLFSCAPGRHANYAASSLLALGDPAKALLETERATAEFAFGGYGFGTIAQNDLTRAFAMLAGDAVDGAAAAARPVLDLPPGKRLATLADRLRPLARALADQRYAESPVATDLREEIIEFCAVATRRQITAGGDTEELA